MKRLFPWLLAITIATLTLVAHEEVWAINKKRWVLFQITAVNTNEAYARQVFSELRRTLATSKKLTLVSETKEGLARKIEAKRKSGCSAEECLTTVGKELSVDKVLSGELRQMPDRTFRLELSLVDVLSGEYECLYDDIKGEGVSDFSKMAAAAAYAVDSRIYVQPVIQEVNNNSVMIDAGADLGVKKGESFIVERITNLKTDSQGKILWADTIHVGRIAVSAVQAGGAWASIVSEQVPIERGDFAVVDSAGEFAYDAPKIVHTSVPFGVQGKSIAITASIVNSKRVDSALVYYRSNDGTEFRSVILAHTDKDRYSAVIPADDVRGQRLEYYIVAKDSGRDVATKYQESGTPFVISVVRDQDPPTIEHTPLVEVNASDRIEIRALVKDNVRVGRVVAQVRANPTSAYSPWEMTWQGGDAYAVILPEHYADTTDVLSYYLSASDEAGNPKRYPDAPNVFQVRVSRKDVTGPSISHNEIKSYHTGYPLTFDAQITDRSGVRRAVLYIKPPYAALYRKVNMVPRDRTNYRAEVPPDVAEEGTTKLQYYIYAEDSAGNGNSFGQSDAPIEMVCLDNEVAGFTEASPDDTPPYVDHWPARVYKPALGYTFKVDADDESDVGSVTVFYHGPQEPDFHKMQLHRGPGYFWGYLPASIEPLAYYIECRDIYSNLTTVASPGSPIIVTPTETIKGRDRYTRGNAPFIRPHELRIVEPAELAEFGSLGSGYTEPIGVRGDHAESTLHVEGILESSRRCLAVYADSIRAELLPLSPLELRSYVSSRRLTKFSVDMPAPADGSILRIAAWDILDKSAKWEFKYRNRFRQSPVFIASSQGQATKPEVRLPNITITHPLMADNLNTISVAATNGTMTLGGNLGHEPAVTRVEVTAGGYIEEALLGRDSTGAITFSKSLSLPGDDNQILIRAWTADGRYKDRTITVRSIKPSVAVADSMPPIVDVLSPQPGQTMHSGKLRLSARVIDDTRVDSVWVMLGDSAVKNVKFTRTGRAQIVIDDTLALSPGQNVIQIRAWDGHQFATRKVTVDYNLALQPLQIVPISPEAGMVATEVIPFHFSVAGFRTGMKVSVLNNGTVIRPNLAMGRSQPDNPETPVDFPDTIRLLPGKNRIECIVSGEGQSASFQETFIFGWPTFSILAPADTLVHQSSTELRVLTTNVAGPGGITIRVNGQLLAPERKIDVVDLVGKVFVRQISLKEGLNRIFVRVANDVGADSDEISIRFKGSVLPEARYLAMIVGVQQYPRMPDHDLRSPIQDARNLRDVLVSNYTFEPNDVKFLQNPDRQVIIDSFGELRKEVRESDNVLIFYAGHGMWDDNSKTGYWLPSDATQGSIAQWLTNADIRDAIKRLAARHVLLIADACFAGSILAQTRGLPTSIDAIPRLNERKSRKAMTSGLTVTPDDSPFLKYLLKALKENREHYLSADALFNQFKDAVIVNSATNSIPEYSILQSADDEGGEFIFVRR